MARSAKRPEPLRRKGVAPARGPVRRGPTLAGRVAELAGRNPQVLGGGAVFLLALSFVSANAIWYQPYRHSGAFFATRPITEPLPQEAVPEPLPAADPTLKRAQAALKTLGVYSGPLDGLDGPATRRAIAAFQQKNGLVVSGELDETAIAALVDQTTTTQTIPSSRPLASPAAEVLGDAERVKRVQAGLKAFGNEAIAVDGIMGARTQSAIREFQGLFGLEKTGEADDALYTKMREIGLTN
jgi:peptidoglycan hydrolase-like protein with peptidoglycan-binding domain